MNKKTVGTLLRERRNLLSMSIEEVAGVIGVSAKHLRRIERDDWGTLPSAVYTRSFVRAYARALGADAERTVDRYEREAGVKQEKYAVPPEPHALVQFMRTLTPRTTRSIAVSLAFLALVAYIGYQLSVVFADPALTITEPRERETIIEESSIGLAGATEPGAAVLLNNQPIEVGSDGTFQKTVELLPGINVLTITAISRFDERTTVERIVIFKEPEPPLLTPRAQGGGAVFPPDGVSTTTATSS